MRIPMMRFETISDCNYDCEMCAHGPMRLRPFLLTLDQLQIFLEVTKESGYFIEDFRMHGIGEPLLWPHLKEGLEMVRQSGVIGHVFMATNGAAANKVDASTWDLIDECRISLYGDNKIKNHANYLKKVYPEKITVDEPENFAALPKAGESRPIPCDCRCRGPMFYGDKIFLYCGPPIFGAADAMGLDAEKDNDLWVPVQKNYMDLAKPNKIGNLKYCSTCWGNSAYLDMVKVSTDGGNW